MEERHSRQTFLGIDSEEIIRCCKVAIIGLGGGGSHIVQQLAHIGFINFVLYDGQTIEESNLNRLIGAYKSDSEFATPKIEIAQRLIRGLQPTANIQAFKTRWQENPVPLRDCDIIFGCLDGFAERQEIEICARRYLIPYIDIGLDVHPGTPPQMSGQVILSLPGKHCMKCMGFLSDRNLAIEASNYGVAGVRPQVVWGNGVLASLAVGIGVNLITGWTLPDENIVYLSYDGNQGLVNNHVRLDHLQQDQCQHFPLSDVGDPIYRLLH